MALLGDKSQSGAERRSTPFTVMGRDVAVFCLIAALLTAFMLWPLLHGHLWIIDDHENVAFSHALHQGGLSLMNFWTVLSSTEVVTLDYGRYRPVYYFFRVLKAAVFGDNAGLWFAFNASLLFLSFVTVGICLKRYFSWFWVVLGMVAFGALPFHAGLWGRLGPAEIDPVLWGSLALLGALGHWAHRRWGWPLFCVAAALAIGCKENFILLLIPAAWLLWVSWRRQSLRVSQFVWLVIPLVVSIPVGVILFKSVFISGADLYGVSTRQGALKSAGLFLVAGGGAYFSYILLTALISFRHKMLDGSTVRDALGAWGVIFLMLLGNYAFYRGDVGGLNRYGVPYHALLLLEFFIVLFVLRTPLSQIFTYRDGRTLFVRWSAVAVCGLGAVLALVGLSLNTMRVASQVWNTEIFADFLKTAQDYRAVGIITTGPALGWTYEPLNSLRRYHDAGYLPEVFYIPVFSKGEGKGLSDMEERLSSLNTSLKLGPETLLVEFGAPNKKVYLGNIWQKIAYFTHPWTNPHWFRIIEHSGAVRPMAKVLADRPVLPLNERGEAVIDGDTTLYVPVDHVTSGSLLLQMPSPLTVGHCWQVTVNGQDTVISVVPEGLEVTVDADVWTRWQHHPQVMEVGLKCVTGDSGAMQEPIRLLSLVVKH